MAHDLIGGLDDFVFIDFDRVEYPPSAYCGPAECVATSCSSRFFIVSDSAS